LKNLDLIAGKNVSFGENI